MSVLSRASLDEVEDSQLTLIRVHAEHKVECGIMSVDQSPVPSPQLTVRETEARAGHAGLQLTLSPPGSCSCCRLSWRPCGTPPLSPSAAHPLSGGQYIERHLQTTRVYALKTYVMNKELGEPRLALVVEH